MLEISGVIDKMPQNNANIISIYTFLKRYQCPIEQCLICAFHVTTKIFFKKEKRNRPQLGLFHASQMYLCEALFRHKIYN